MSTNLDVYEALKEHLGAQVARTVAEAIPVSADLATRNDMLVLRGDFEGLRADFAGLRSEFEGLRADVRTEIADLRTETRTAIADLRTEMRAGFEGARADREAMQAQLSRWMLGYFVPMWIGVWGAVGVALFK